MAKTKVLKIQVGYVFIDGKKHDVYTDAWEKTSKKGTKYYQMVNPIFVSEVEIEDKKENQGA